MYCSLIEQLALHVCHMTINDYFVNVGSTLSSNIHCNVNPLSYVEATILTVWLHQV